VRKKRVDPTVEASPETERKAAQASGEARRGRGRLGFGEGGGQSGRVEVGASRSGGVFFTPSPETEWKAAEASSR
jgi:hypothetical protein